MRWSGGLGMRLVHGPFPGIKATTQLGFSFAGICAPGTAFISSEIGHTHGFLGEGALWRRGMLTQMSLSEELNALHDGGRGGKIRWARRGLTGGGRVIRCY